MSESINKYITTGLSFYDQFVSDLQASWKISLIALFTALVLSIVLLLFIRACGKCIVISIIILYLAALISLGIFCMKASKDGIDIEGYEDWTNPEALEATAYICWTLAGFSIIALCCSLKKLRVAAAILKAAAEFTRQ
jgi:Mn2+/Fe2+ NRAMP family transporter